MSYSRWGSRGSGNWYTFWEAQDEDTENIDTAKFCICAVKTFTAKEIRDDIDKCLQEVSKIDKEGDTEELRQYMLEFVSDVDAMYTKDNNGTIS